MTVVPTITSFIGEEFAPGSAGFEWVRPQDGQVVGRIAEAGKSGVDAAVAAASAAFAAHRKAPAHQRIAWLKAGAAGLSEKPEVRAKRITGDEG
jgi:acyl-CoA reductase-like NAD-dependent aldehyde dehydrogenase